MKTVIRDGPKAIAASVVGAIAPTVSPIADAANDSTVTMPENFPNLEVKIRQYKLILMTKAKHLSSARTKCRYPSKSDISGNIFKSQ